MIAPAPPAATTGLVAADRTLARQILSHLAETNRASLRRLSVDARGGAVTLRGNVGSFHEKQIAIQTCRLMAGIDHLIDAVEVAAAS